MSRGMWSSSSEDEESTEIDRQKLSNLASAFTRDSKGDVTHVTIGGQLLCIVRSGDGDTDVCERGETHVHGADVNGANPERLNYLGQALQTNRTYRYVTHVTIGDGGCFKVGPEGMKHLGQALQTNRTVAHVTIGGQLLCIVRSVCVQMGV